MDIMSKAERSKRMFLIKSRWTSQEKKFHNYLKGNKIKHKMHPNLPGNPDILIKNSKVIFLHGCFWHKCPKCFKAPKTNKKYWSKKLENNVKRHEAKKLELQGLGFKILTIWEHETRKDFENFMESIIK